MQYVRLGKSGLKVSRLCLGCMSYGTPGNTRQSWALGETDARPFFRRAADAGVNFFDTADACWTRCLRRTRRTGTSACCAEALALLIKP